MVVNSVTKPKFPKRHPLLLLMEGWYDSFDYYSRPTKFKFSCKFNDILRCSSFNKKVEHFYSCYAYRTDQPLKRCFHPKWAIIYIPDKYGNFQSRCFVSLKMYLGLVPELTFYMIYGRGLSYKWMKESLRKKFPFLILRSGPIDRTL